MVDHAENVDCGAFVSEKFWHHFWQKTFSAESHLKCGNSLIGVTEIGKFVAPASQKEAEIKRILQNIVAISQLTDSTPSEVEESYKLYEDVLKRQEPFKRRFHVSTAVSFIPSITPSNLGNIEQLAESGDLSNAHADHIIAYKDALATADKLGFFHWPLEFPDAFFGPIGEQKDSGFDAVIGNPPYVRQEALAESKPYLLKTYAAAHGMADIYVYFFDQGLRLLRGGGQLGLISSNKFMRANYGTPLRKRLTQGVHVEQIIDFGELPVFPEAATFPAIFIIRNNPPETGLTRYAPLKTLSFRSLEDAVKEHVGLLSPLTLSTEGWSLSGQVEDGIRKKMEKVSQPLGDYCEGKLYRGVTTGLNKAFVIDRKTRDQIITEEPKCTSIIKPFLVGDDIRRYEIHFQEMYLIFARRGIDIDEFPSVKKYLEQFKEDLTPKSKVSDSIGRKPGDYEWYEIQDTTAYFPEFEKPKIIYPDIAITCRFALDSIGGYYLGNTGYILPRNDLYLLAVLNSKLVEFYYKLISPVLGDASLRGRLRVIDSFVSKIPIRSITSTASKHDLTRLLEKCQALYQRCLAKNEFLCVTGFVDHCLTQKPEQADAVHDLLAFLAERMMAMNKEKQAETKGFLEWLETNIGAKVESLKNKTKISAYHEGSLEDLLEILKENRKVLTVNPASIDFFKPLKDAFEKSIAKLSPLKANLATTDRLIDLIVYRLYGLTDKEVKIVEET